MAIEPDFAAFERAYAQGRPQALHARLIADLETPVSAFLKLGEGRDNAFLLESVQGGETRGRYSIIGLKPDLIWRCRDGKAEINRNARANPNSFSAAEHADRPLESLRALRQSAESQIETLLRRAGVEGARVQERGAGGGGGGPPGGGGAGGPPG